MANKKEQATLSLKNKLGITFSYPPPNNSLILDASVVPWMGEDRERESRKSPQVSVPEPGQNGSRKRERSQKPPGDPAGAGAMF